MARMKLIKNDESGMEWVLSEDPITEEEIALMGEAPGPAEPFELPYGAKRRQEYPLIEEQLDMLWHSMDSGEIPKAEPFYTNIKEIKDKYPKT